MLVQLTLTDTEIKHIKKILKAASSDAEGLEKEFTDNVLERIFEAQNFEPQISRR